MPYRFWQDKVLPTAWAVLQNNPTGGVFSGTIRLLGGWYTLEVRGSKDGKLVGRFLRCFPHGCG